MSPKVSIIMPCFNSKDFILKSINSVLNQTYTNWELVIVSDDLFDYKSFIQNNNINDKRIVYTSTLKSGSGVSNARNLGIKESSGEIISLLDSDDFLLPSKLEKVIPKVIDYGFVSSAIEYRAENEKIINTIGVFDKDRLLTAETYPFVNFLNGTITYDRNKIPLLFSENYLVLEDLIFVVSAYDYVDNIYHLSEILHVCYYNKNSLSNSDFSSGVFVSTKEQILNDIKIGTLCFKKKESELSLKKFVEMSLKLEKEFLENKIGNKNQFFANFVKERICNL